MTPSEFAKLRRVTPAEAVAYLAGRGKIVATYDWRDLWQEEHAHQFTVSRLARLDILKSIQDGITASVAGDLSRRDFTRDLTGLLQKEGWWGKVPVRDPATGEVVTTDFSPHRVKLIYDVNTRQAHAAGRWERFERNAGTHPFIRYITKRDERVRASHREWDNVTLPVGHAFWDTHAAPNGWRCRCRLMSMTQAEYDAGHAPTGAELKKVAPPVKWRDWENKRTGQTMRVPVGIDPGFGYNPGRAGMRKQALDRVVADKLAGAPAGLAAAAERAGLRGDALPGAAERLDDARMELSSFASRARAIADRRTVIDLGAVTGDERLHEITGGRIDGYRRIIDNYGVRHTLKKHGNVKTEAARGQIAVTEQDFDLIPLITGEYDRVFLDGKNKVGRDVIVFVKVINGIGYRYVEEIQPRAKCVVTDSMRKKSGAWES